MNDPAKWTRFLFFNETDYVNPPVFFSFYFDRMNGLVRGQIISQNAFLVYFCRTIVWYFWKQDSNKRFGNAKFKDQCEQKQNASATEKKK